MATRWKGVHHPAAMKWVRNREDARRYYESEAAADIYVRVDGEQTTLADMEPEAREAWTALFLQRFDRYGWLAGTAADADAAMEKARQMAGPGETPVVGVQTDKGIVFKASLPKKGRA